MLKIYGHPGSRAARPLWVCRELGLQYEHVPTHFADGGTKSPEFLAINPAGRIPAIDDGGFRLAESMAINIYSRRSTVASSRPSRSKTKRACCSGRSGP